MSPLTTARPATARQTALSFVLGLGKKVSDPIKEEKKQYAWLHKTDSTTDLHASIPIKLSHYMNMHFSGHLLKMHTELLENIVFKDIEMFIQF